MRTYYLDLSRCPDSFVPAQRALDGDNGMFWDDPAKMARALRIGARLIP